MANAKKQALPMVSLPIDYDETHAIYDRTIGAGNRSVLITASEHGEGVSTAAYALAQRAAANGKKTLLVEFNTYSPYLSGRLKLPETPWRLDGLSLKRDIYRIPHSNLSFLPTPQTRNFPVETRNDESLRAFLSIVEAEFDVVIVDAPCIGQPNLNGISTRMLARHFASTLLVVASNKTTRNQLASTVSQLVEADVVLGGCILNDQIYPSLHAEIARQFNKFGWLGRKFWSLIDAPLHRAPFMSDRF